MDRTSRPRRSQMTGSELKKLRAALSSAIGRQLTAADMARLCGLPAENGDTIRRRAVTGPSGPASQLLRMLAMASDEYPILEKFQRVRSLRCPRAGSSGTPLAVSRDDARRGAAPARVGRRQNFLTPLSRAGTTALRSFD